MINIRTTHFADQANINTVHTWAFGQDNEAELVEKISASDRFIPELSLVAEIDGVVVGHILFSYIALVGDTTLKVLSLAPLAVLPSFQKQGIGSALVKAGLDIANARGDSLVLVLGNPNFYNRFGFVPSIAHGIQSPFALPENFFMVNPLQNYQEKYRGQVIYPPAFDGF